MDFPSRVAGNQGFPYEVSLISYNNIPHPPSASPLDVSNQTVVLEQLGAWRRNFLKYQNDLKFAIEHQEQFPGIDIRGVNDRYNKINLEIAKIVGAARNCYGNQTRCEVPQIDLTLLENVLPPQTEGVAQETMISGTVFRSYADINHPIFSGTPVGNRSDTIHVDFPAGKFSTPPIVRVVLSSIDVDKNTNTRLITEATNITADGFDVRIATWAETRIYRVGVTWFAHTE